ncbi:hypothetical protein niasHT_022644 [Heterodera trifolii]|uniref:Uncharacterized protein n=1 Tax=Heterodera trifolii TaxID=157864 RepID=A0ABD2JRE7_9BILA
MMDFNEETDILHRLGILASKLECPNKQFPLSKAKDKSTSRDTNPSFCSVTAAEDGDGWGAFSLDELSSSSDDSEFLFDRRELNINGKVNRRVRTHRQGHIPHQSLPRTGTPNLWKLLALLSVASFAGFSMVLSHGRLSLSSSSPTDQNIPLFYLLRICGFHALALWVGSIFASSVLLKTNPFSVFLTLMLIFTFICAQIRMAETVTDSKVISHSVVLFLCVSQAFVEGAIQRGLLLLSPLWTVRFHRVLFLCYAAFAFSAGGAFHMQNIQSQHNVSTKNIPSLLWTFPSFSGNSIGFAKIERRHRRADSETNKNIPSFLELNLNNNTYEQYKTNFSPADGNVTTNSTNNYRNNKKAPTEFDIEKQKQQSPMFKTKTEENAFRRKEVEEKRKKEEEEEQKKRKKEEKEEPKIGEEKEEKPKSEEAQKRKNEEQQSAVSPPSSPPVTISAVPMPSVIGTTTVVSTKLSSHLSLSPNGVLFSFSVLIGLSIFILPLLFGFCCCCAIDHPICSTQYRHLEELVSPPASAPLGCHLFSMVICALHSALIATMQLSLTMSSSSFSIASVSFSSSSVFWVSLAFSRLLFVFRPSLACKASSLHCLYFTSLLSCSSLHFVSLSDPFVLFFGIVFLGFSSANIPLLLYVWHCSSSPSSSLFSASGRFIAAMAFGQLVGPMGFVWWNGNGEGSIPRSSFEVSAVFYFGFAILVLSYVLFLLMLAKLRKSQRQQQITQLSGALNGDAQKSRKKVKSPKGRTKGPYKALFSSVAGDESNDALFERGILDDSEEEKESEEIVDLEMESIGGEEQHNDGGQRMDKRPRGAHSLV